MKNLDYLNKLLVLCTEKQNALFDRMYPGGPSSTQAKRAIQQVENTLSDLNTTNEELRSAKQEIEIITDKSNDELSALISKLKSVEQELKESKALIERLQNPINVENNNIQERLDLLDALEAGGVDNWEWYDESISNHRND